MIIIHKAILHILDFNSGVTVFSDNELSVENSVETFMLKHIEKSYQDQDLKAGQFYEDSVFKALLMKYTQSDEFSFVEFSRTIAERMYEHIAKSDKLDSADLLMADITIDDERMIALFKCNNKIGFIHQVTQTEDGIRNEIINHYAIMPNLSQKIDEYAFINLQAQTIHFIDKKYSINGESVSLLPDCILECAYTVSPKTTIAQVTAIAKKVAENHGQSTLTAVTNAKTFIAENAQSSEYLQPIEIGKEIFKASPAMQEEYIAEIASANMADTIKVEQEFAIKKTKTHKIKTDTGIELIIPLDYFQNTDYVEFINNPDGTLSINLKKIMNVVNK